MISKLLRLFESKDKKDLREARETMSDLVWHLNLMTPATTGNFSMRVKDGFLITPSGMPYDEMEPEDFVYIDREGNQVEPKGENLPSSEWRMHLDIYLNRPEVESIVHTHSEAATSVASIRNLNKIPYFHYNIALFGVKEIPFADYRTFGTPELSQSVVKALGSLAQGCLIRNHGVVTLGSTPWGAINRAKEMESLCYMYISLMQANAPISVLSDEEYYAARKQFEDLCFIEFND